MSETRRNRHYRSTQTSILEALLIDHKTSTPTVAPPLSVGGLREKKELENMEERLKYFENRLKKVFFEEIMAENFL